MAPLSQLGSVATPVQLRRSGNQFFVPVQIMSLPAAQRNIFSRSIPACLRSLRRKRATANSA